MSRKRTMSWILIIVVLVAIVTVVFLSFRGTSADPRSDSIPSFTADPRNDKVILVKGWNEAEMQKIIHDFKATYQNGGYPAFMIDAHKQSENLYRLTFPQDIHPLLFTFLVNYIAYPFDLDPKDRTIVVGGKTTLNTGFEGIDQSLVGKKAIFYLPENDKDHDVVYMQTETGIDLLMSFDRMQWTTANGARLPEDAKNLIDGN